MANGCSCTHDPCERAFSCAGNGERLHLELDCETGAAHGGVRCEIIVVRALPWPLLSARRGDEPRVPSVGKESPGAVGGL